MYVVEASKPDDPWYWQEWREFKTKGEAEGLVDHLRPELKKGISLRIIKRVKQYEPTT